MSEAAGEAKNTTAPATSIGSPMRCSAAILSSTSARFCGTERYSSVPGVRMNVGATALTVIPCLPHSGDTQWQLEGPSPQAFNFADQFASRRNIAKPEGHICSRMRQGQRNCASQPASRSGHQCHLPLQIKSWEVIHAGRLYNSSLLRTENRELKFNRKLSEESFGLRRSA